MQIRYTGQNMEVTPALREFIDSKFSRLERFAKHITNVHIIFIVNKLQQIVEAQLHFYNSEIHARSESENMYKAIDEMMDKLVRQLTKHKEKQEEHR